MYVVLGPQTDSNAILYIYSVKTLLDRQESDNDKPKWKNMSARILKWLKWVQLKVFYWKETWQLL